MTAATLDGGRERRGVKAIVGGAVVGAAVGFIAVNALGHLRPERYDLSPGKNFSCTVLSVYDGDGPINCAELDTEGRPIAVRLRGIEAREYDDSCQSPELCPAASGAAAKAILVGLARGKLECVSYGPSFRRVDSRCVNAAGTDLSCEMLKSGTAVRWARFDPEGRLAKCVPPRGERGRDGDGRQSAAARPVAVPPERRVRETAFAPATPEVGTQAQAAPRERAAASPPAMRARAERQRSALASPPPAGAAPAGPPARGRTT